MNSCNKILQILLQNPNAAYFLKPVDPVALGLIDYIKIVKFPMDLGTISERLLAGYYNLPEDVDVTKFYIPELEGKSVMDSSIYNSDPRKDLIDLPVETKNIGSNIVCEYLYIYIYMCVYVCECMKNREIYREIFTTH